MHPSYHGENDTIGRVRMLGVQNFPTELKNSVVEVAVGERGITLKHAILEALCVWLRMHNKRVPKFHRCEKIDKCWTNHGKKKKGK